MTESCNFTYIAVAICSSAVTGQLESLFVDPDYSLVSYSSSSPLPTSSVVYHPAVDPTGSNS